MNETITTQCQICTTSFVRGNKQRFCSKCREHDSDVYKSAARLEKALKLSTALAGVGAGPTDIHSATTRRLAEKIAGVSQSSDATWAMVAVLLKGDA